MKNGVTKSRPSFLCGAPEESVTADFSVFVCTQLAAESVPNRFTLYGTSLFARASPICLRINQAQKTGPKARGTEERSFRTRSRLARGGCALVFRLMHVNAFQIRNHSQAHKSSSSDLMSLR
jgi:hypothetical protein